MPVDHIELLGWMAARERREVNYIDGTQLMVDARHLAGSDLDPWQSLARALELLIREDCIAWQSDLGLAAFSTNGPVNPDAVRGMRSICVSATGHVMCLAAQAQTPAQINIFNHSSVGTSRDGREPDRRRTPSVRPRARGA